MEKKILITGTTSGLGKDLAKFYLKKNFKVIGIARRKKSIRNKNYFHYSFDLSDKNNSYQNIKKIFRSHKDIKYLINNHASNNSYGLLVTNENEKIRSDIRLNIISNIVLTKFAAMMMIKNGYGRIVNIGSIASELCLPGDAVYASSKSFLQTFTKITGKELKNFGISCNMISISLYNGSLIKNISDTQIKKIKKKYKMKNLIKLEQITSYLDKNIFTEKIKVNSKIYKIFN